MDESVPNDSTSGECPAGGRAVDMGPARVAGTGDDKLTFAALGAIIERIEDLARSEVPTPGHRLELLGGLDDRASALLQACLFPAGSLTQRNLQRGDPLVGLARDVFGAILDAYQGCAERCLRTGADVLVQRDCDRRLLCAATERMRWERFAQGPAHPHLWRWASTALRRSGRPGAGSETAAVGEYGEFIEREYLRLVAVFSAGYDQLGPEAFPVVTRLVELLLPKLQLHAKPIQGAICYLDVCIGAAPTRLVRAPAESDAIRFLSAEAAGTMLKSFHGELARGAVPMELASLSAYGKLLVTGVGHLFLQWSCAMPVRAHRRHAIDGDVLAVRGMDEVSSVLSGSFSPASEEVWRFSDVSRGGIGALAPTTSTPQPDIGELIALRCAEGGRWHLGVVRRVWRESDELVRLGVQTLSTSPYVARADDGRTPADVLVCDTLQRGETIRIVVPARQLAFGGPLFLSGSGTLHKLRPIEAEPVGEASEVWTYKVL